MAKKKKSYKPKPKKESIKRNPWLGESAPWEEYSGSSVPVMGEDGTIVNILEIGGGQLKVTSPAVPTSEGDAFADGSNRHATTIVSVGNPLDVLLEEHIKISAMEQSYKFFRENSSYKAVIKAYRNFIIGKGVRITAQDEDPKVQEYIDEFMKVNKFDGKDSEIVLRFLKTGEVAIRWFTTDKNNRLAKVPKIRFVSFWRITKVTKDPEDFEIDASYEIQVSKTNDRFSATVPKTLTPKEMSFWKLADPEEGRGEPPFLVIMRGCTWYSDWLKNRVILNRFRTAHVLFKKIKGSPARTSGVSNATPDAPGKKGLGSKLEKRLPKPGTIVTHNESVEYEWKSPELGAGDAKEDGRHIKLDIAAGAQVPEFILGDAGNSNRASILTAEDPFIREVEFWQDHFKTIFSEIFEKVIKHGIEVGKIPKKSHETIISESSGFMRRVNKVLSALSLKEVDAKGDELQRKSIDTKTTVIVEYPDPLRKDELKEVKALQIDQTMGLVSVETLRTRRGYDNDTENRRIENESAAGGDKFDDDRKKDIDNEDDDKEDGEDEE